MAVRRVDDDQIDAGCNESPDAILRVAPDSHGRADTQALMAVLGRIRIVARFLDVLDRDQAAQLERVVHDQHFLDAVLVQQRQHLVFAGAFLDRDELVLARHDVAHRVLGPFLEAQVAIRHDADELFAVDDRKRRKCSRRG
jgi:hypothetical protein